MIRPFEGVFGNTCELRLLEFLLPLEGMEFNITELSEEAGVSRNTVGKVVRKFVEWGILTASTDQIPRYSLNPTSPIVQSLDILNNSLIGRMLGDEKVQEIHDYVQEHASAAGFSGTETSTEEEWRNFPVRPAAGSGWGAGDGWCVGEPNSLSPAPPYATADDYERGFPGYIQ